jgi:tetratricopeptide (TPR) repeat protein
VTIFPVIKPITLAGEVIAADRYTYLPSIGFLYLACYFFDRIFQRSRRVVSVRYLFFGILFVLIVFLSFLTWRRNFVFRDRVTLWDDVLKNYPFTAMAYMRRANYYFGKSQFEKTIQDMEVFLKMFPEDPEAHYLKGLAHKYLKEYQQAFFEFNRAAELKPSMTSVYLVRGRLFGLLKDYERAEADFKKAAALEPDNGQAYYNLALVAYYKGKKALVGPLIKKSQNLGYKIDPLSLMVISSVPKK